MDSGAIPAPGITTFPILIIALSVYHITDRLLHRLFSQYCPKLYARLKEQNKHVRYMAFIAGMFMTTVSAPACFHAAMAPPPNSMSRLESDTSMHFTGLEQLSTIFPSSAQVCLVIRTTNWISELTRFDFSTELIFHHIMSLANMSYMLQNTLPLRVVLFIYASLFTEVLYQVLFMLTIHGYTHKNSKMMRWLHMFFTAHMIVLRMPPVVYGLVVAWYLQGSQRIIGGLMMSIYGIYCLYRIRIELSRDGINWRNAKKLLQRWTGQQSGAATGFVTAVSKLQGEVESLAKASEKIYVIEIATPGTNE